MKPYSKRISVLERPQVVEPKIPDYMVTFTQRDDLKTAFALFTSPNQSTITLSEAKSVMWHFGYWKLTEKQFESAMTESHVNLSKGRITFEELLSVITKRYYSGGKNNKIQEIFEVFDNKGKGVTLAEIQKVLKENLEFGVSDHEIEEAMEGVNLGKNGEIGFEEFASM